MSAHNFTMRKRLFYVSSVAAIAVFAALPAFAQLKIDPYPSGATARTQAKAVPMDIVDLPAPQVQPQTVQSPEEAALEELEGLTSTYSKAMRNEMSGPLDYAPPPPVGRISAEDFVADDIPDDVAQGLVPLEDDPEAYKMLRPDLALKAKDEMEAKRSAQAAMMPAAPSARAPGMQPVYEAGYGAAAYSAPAPMPMARTAENLNIEDLKAGAMPKSGRYVMGASSPEDMSARAMPQQPAPLYATTSRQTPADRLYTKPGMVSEPMIDEAAITGVMPATDVAMPNAVAVGERPPAPVAAPMIPASGSEYWNTFAGANLRETLSIWSQKAGVEFLWPDRDYEFEVQATLAEQTTYEAAVQAVLEQYENGRVRPVGSLHVDPQTGKRTLLIQILDTR
ncbi:MAG: TcpQ domain-containing protein [Alphaproteobacteria bacterium]|nr:TcpQ domain-containing protein [Alphaproteobacteria bacterium]